MVGFMTLLLTVLAADEPRPLYLVVDDSRESRILVAELRRDWSDSRFTKSVSAETAILNARCAIVRSRVTFIRRTDREVKLPAFRFGYGELTAFDARAFSDSGRSLQTVETLLTNFDTDLTEWKRTCDAIMTSAEFAHATKTAQWLRDEHGINLFSESEYPWIGTYLAVTWGEIEERYGTLPNFPKKPDVVLPPSPLKKMPWE